MDADQREALQAKLYELAEAQKKVKETAALVVAGAGMHSLYMASIFILIILIIFVRVSSLERGRARWKDSDKRS
jgi:hypothetical protein